MTTPVDVVNLALSECGQRIFLNNLNQTDQPAAAVARLNYTPRLRALTRAANWDFARAQGPLTLYKQAIVNGAASGNPPPQPWLFEYLLPPDCLDARFVMPTIPVQPGGTPLTTAPIPLAQAPPAFTSAPFVIATDMDPTHNSIRVLLTNVPMAQLVYTRDLTQQPDLWDDLFLSAATSYLATYFIQALQRNAQAYQQQVSATKGLIDTARAKSANEGISSVDHVPDWIAVRSVSGLGNSWNQGPAPNGYWGWSSLGFPDGLRY